MFRSGFRRLFMPGTQKKPRGSAWPFRRTFWGDISDALQGAELGAVNGYQLVKELFQSVHSKNLLLFQKMYFKVGFQAGP